MSDPRWYQKKPVAVQVMRYDGANAALIIAWAGDENIRDGANGLEISTLEGVMTASIGDIVVKGIAGEFHPVKPAIFAETYTPASDELQSYLERATNVERWYVDAVSELLVARKRIEELEESLSEKRELLTARARVQELEAQLRGTGGGA